MVLRRGLALLMLLAIAGCSAGGTGKHQRPSGPPLVIPKPSPSSTARPRPVGAGASCGRVTTLNGSPARVVVARGRTTCAEALRVFRKYYDPSTPAEGSAGLVVIDHWTCETRPRLSMCTLRATTIQARS